MRIAIVAIGRARGGPEAELYSHYAGRIQAWPVTLVERELRRKAPEGGAAAAEAELLLQAIPDGAYVVALDEAGKQAGSRDFAGRLRRLQEEARADMAFIIGGADGLADSVRQRADLLLSLGKATWPHMMVRGMLAEQIYRAQQILAGHPYHRD